MSDPDEMTVDELRLALAERIPAHAAFDGWAPAALAQAAAELGVPADRAALAFPDGAIGMIDAWFEVIDRAMSAAVPPPAMAALKMRERIAEAVWTRIVAAGPHREALRRALALLALPQNAPRAARMLWRSADAMWRLAGDSATDFNHYTKRLTLAGVYSATLLAWLGDDSEGFAETRGFLDRRIDGVMRFERLKAQLIPHPGERLSVARFLGRLRYPAT